ncbi:uncharacterized protein LOC124353734 isoform X2 [Homalodisca vitripennis]|uniref:uncharacterized protein LOC124353734 isoform X2 n=1 Tax=Homalodisca vitripennis TaxID=197043 RepID=UPI001EEB22FC|nr:uncharacterized protein LOC124353734 isoform X2 [Homalodisca vitripennis]
MAAVVHHGAGGSSWQAALVNIPLPTHPPPPHKFSVSVSLVASVFSRMLHISFTVSRLLLYSAISKDEPEDARNRVTKLPFNGYSDEFLDRLEPNGNIPADKDLRYGESLVLVFLVGWGNCNTSVGFLLQRSIVTV